MTDGTVQGERALRAAVEAAFREGFAAAATHEYDADDLETEWLESDALAALAATPGQTPPPTGETQ
jgi:hypothetical protein